MLQYYHNLFVFVKFNREINLCSRLRREQRHFPGSARALQSSGSDGIHIQPRSLHLPLGSGMSGAPLQRDADGLSLGQVAIFNRSRKRPSALTGPGATSTATATAATAAAAAAAWQQTAA